jgi:AcrR family transcriptional regulator
MAPAPVQRVQVTARREKARERIAAEACELLRDRAFAELTVDEVMRRAGMGRTLFYRHFDDLAGVLRRAGREAIEELYAAQATLADVEAAIALAVAVYESHGPLLRAVVEAAAHDEGLAAQHAALRRRFDELATASLVASGAPLRDAAQTAHALNLMNESYLLDAFGREPRVDTATAARTLAEIWAAVTATTDRRGAR